MCVGGGEEEEYRVNCELVNDPLRTTSYLRMHAVLLVCIVLRVCVCVGMYCMCVCACLPMCACDGQVDKGGGAVAHTIIYIPFFLCNLVGLQLSSYVDSQSKSFVEPILGLLCVCRSLKA